MQGLKANIVPNDIDVINFIILLFFKFYSSSQYFPYT